MKFLDRKQHWYSGELGAVIKMVKVIKETRLIESKDIKMEVN